MIDNLDLKARIRTGLLSFPVTPFTEDGAFAPGRSAPTWNGCPTILSLV